MTYTGRSRLADFARGLAALVVFLFFLVGCPVAMYAMGGSPIPDRFPSWEEISATLMRQDTDQSVFLATIFLIGWGAWCLFIITVCSEAVNYVAGRSRSVAPRPVRPLQELVRNLVATATLTFSAVASLSASASAAAATNTHAVAADAPAATVPEAGSHEQSSPRQDTPPQGPTESEWTPLLADEPSTQPKPDHHEAQTHVVKRGETLWGLARRTYGSGDRYPEIFENSRNIDQPNGFPALTDPDVIHPGQRVRLPRSSTPDGAPSPARSAAPHAGAHMSPAEQGKQSDTRASTPRDSTSAKATASPVPSPVVAPPVVPSVSSAPAATNDQDDASSPLAISLPSGSRIGLGLAAALSVAVAATRLHRRRRRPLKGDPETAEHIPEAPIAAPVLRARKAHLDTYVVREVPAPSDPELVREDLLTPEPDHLIVGTRDGEAVTIPLAGLSLGLTGDGAHAAARAITTELLAKAHRYRAEVILPEPDAQAIFPGDDITDLSTAHDGLTLKPSLHEAINHLETELLHRGRILETTEQPDVAALRADDPAEPLPTVLLVASIPADNARVDALATLGRRYGIGVLALGAWTSGTNVELATDATVTDTDGPNAAQFTQASLFHLTTDDAAEMLRTIRTAAGAETPPPTNAGSAPEPEPESPSAIVPPPRPSEGAARRPVSLEVLGDVRLSTADGPISTERGIDQLLVVGTDMPLRDEVHTIAQAVNPDTRIVYSDADELTLLHADVFYRAEFGGCGFVQAGPDEPREVLYGAAATLDLDRPVGLLLINSLEILSDPKAVAALAAFRAGLATGSCIAVCHLTAEHDHHLVELAGLCAAVNPGPPCIRNPEALATLYAGLEMLEPGLVPVPAWRPDPGPWPIPDDVDLWCGVGVLP